MRVPAALAVLLLAGPLRADMPSEAVAAAEEAVAEGGRAAAEAALDAAWKSKPGAEDRERLALLHQRLKDYAKAEAALKALAAEFPKEPRLRLHLACVAALAGDRSGALARLREAAALKPDPLLRQRMAFLHADLKDWAPARRILDELIAAAPDDAGLRLDRAAVLARTGPRDLGLADLERAAAPAGPPARRRAAAKLYAAFGDRARAAELLSALAKENPKDAAPLLDLAELGDAPGAREALKAAEKLSPGFDGQRRAYAAWLTLGDAKAARAAASRAAALKPRDPRARADLATASARAGDAAAAKAALAEAEALEPDLQDRQRMALLYQDLGEFAKARAMMDALIAEQPRDPQLRLGLAFFEADAGRRDAALAALKDARRLALDPDDSRRMAELYARLNAPPPPGVSTAPAAGAPPPAGGPGATELREREAAKRLDAGDAAGAAKLLDALIEASPAEPRLRVARAAAAAKLGDRAGALAALDKAKGPRLEREERRRAALLRQDLKDFDGALAELTALARANPADAGLRADLGLCRWLAGRGDEAVADLKAAIAADPAGLGAYLTLGAIYGARGDFAGEAALYASAPAGAGPPELRALISKSRTTAESKIPR